jgi:hypothetical protein
VEYVRACLFLHAGGGGSADGHRTDLGHGVVIWRGIPKPGGLYADPQGPAGAVRVQEQSDRGLVKLVRVFDESAAESAACMIHRGPAWANFKTFIYTSHTGNGLSPGECTPVPRNGMQE